MTRKDYQLLASAISSSYNTWNAIAARMAISDVAHELARQLKIDNEKFDRDRFFEACGIIDGNKA